MRVAIDAARFEAAGLGFDQAAGQGVFTLPPDAAGGASVTVRVAVTEGALAFFPQRSSAQRRVLSLLGINDGGG
jgi:hypothetical protein